MATLGENISRAITDFNNIKTALNNSGIIANIMNASNPKNIATIINIAKGLGIFLLSKYFTIGYSA